MKTSDVSLLLCLLVGVGSAPPYPGFLHLRFGAETPAGSTSDRGRGWYGGVGKPSAPASAGGITSEIHAADLPSVKSSSVYERGLRSFSHQGPGFDFNSLFQQISPFPEFSNSATNESYPSIVASFEALQQSSASSGASQGHRETMHDQGESNGNSMAGKEVYSTKESFGHETSASHAIGANQSSAAQNSEGSRHENGHRIQALSHGTNVPSSPIEQPPMVGNSSFPTNESKFAVNNSQTLLASSSQGASNPKPAASINGEKFSNGSRESSQTNSSNSTAYNVGSSDSRSFAHSESLGDKQAFVNGGANKHATQTQRGSESTRIDGSTSTNKFRETSSVES